MTYRGHVQNGQIALDEPAVLPERASIIIELHPNVRITGLYKPEPLSKFKPIEMPGESLADELIRDRR